MDNVLGIGIAELFFIAVIALIVLGPERLPGTLRQIAKFWGYLRNLSRELTSQFSEEFKALEDLNPRKLLNELADEELAKEIRSTAKSAPAKPATTAASKTTTAAAKPASSAATKPATPKPATPKPPTPKPAAKSPTKPKSTATTTATTEPASVESAATENTILPPPAPESTIAVNGDAPSRKEPVVNAAEPSPAEQPALVNATATAAINGADATERTESAG
jgi:sec-independent protein translocase protein TatB